MPMASAGTASRATNTPTPNWKRMPAIMALAMPGGIRRMMRSKEPVTPITKSTAAATR